MSVTANVTGGQITATVQASGVTAAVAGSKIVASPTSSQIDAAVQSVPTSASVSGGSVSANVTASPVSASVSGGVGPQGSQGQTGGVGPVGPTGPQGPAGAGGAIQDGNKGDILVGNSGATWTINSGAVTYGKIQAVSANRILGSASGGGVTEIECTTLGRSIISSSTASNARSALGISSLVGFGAAGTGNPIEVSVGFISSAYAAYTAFCSPADSSTQTVAFRARTGSFSGSGANDFEIRNGPNGDSWRIGTATYHNVEFMTGGATRMLITSADVIMQNSRIGVGTSSPTAGLDVNGNTMRLRTAKTPATAGATGNTGDICWDSSYLYLCIATNTWRRIAHDTW